MEDITPTPNPSRVINDITPGKPAGPRPASASTPISITDADATPVEPASEVIEPDSEETTGEETPPEAPSAEEPIEDTPEEPAPEEPSSEEPTPSEPDSEETQVDEPAHEDTETSDSPETPVEPSEAETDDKPSTETPVEPAAPPKAVTSNGPKKSHKSLLTIIIVLLLILVAAGAGAYYWYSIKPSHKSSTAAVVAKKDIPNIRYVTTNEGWESFYPGFDDASNYDESNIMIFEGLVRFENKTQIVPLLSTGWTNPDSSTWVFTLRPGVKFHDGRVMTADDVKASFDSAKSTSLGETYASTIKSVTATGPLQVTIKTDGPDPTLLKKLTKYFVYDTKSGKANDPINGTGPFVVKPGTVPKPTSLELVANDSYWGGRPHVRSFSFVGIDSNDHAKAYGDGKANLMSMFADTPTLTNNRPYVSQKLDQSSVFIMPLNTLKAGSPLAKLQVRQAIEDAIDPSAIAKVRETDGVPATQLVPNSIVGFDPSVTRPARDVAKAKELLKEAGYPSGISFTLTYFAPSQTTAAEIAKELAEAGIKVNLDPQTDVKTLSSKAFSGQTDAYFNTYTSDIFDASDVLSAFADTPNYKNQAVIDLLTKAGSTLDANKRLGYLQQASKLMADDLGVVPIFSESGDQIIYDPSFVIQRDIANNSIGVYFQKVYAK